MCILYSIFYRLSTTILKSCPQLTTAINIQKESIVSFAQKLSNRIKENINAMIEIRDQRLEICNQCPELRELTRQCKQCGCFVDAKTAIRNQHCPLDKW